MPEIPGGPVQQDCARCGLRWLEAPPVGDPYPQHGTCPRCTFRAGDVLEPPAAVPRPKG